MVSLGGNLERSSAGLIRPLDARPTVKISPCFSVVGALQRDVGGQQRRIEVVVGGRMHPITANTVTPTIGELILDPALPSGDGVDPKRALVAIKGRRGTAMARTCRLAPRGSTTRHTQSVGAQIDVACAERDSCVGLDAVALQKEASSGSNRRNRRSRAVNAWRSTTPSPWTRRVPNGCPRPGRSGIQRPTPSDPPPCRESPGRPQPALHHPSNAK